MKPSNNHSQAHIPICETTGQIYGMRRTGSIVGQSNPGRIFRSRAPEHNNPQEHHNNIDDHQHPHLQGKSGLRPG